MNGLILSAGRGSRLSPFTDDRPKCLVEINGISLLQRQFNALQYAGVKSPIVIAGWMSERVRATGIEVIENSRWNETSMVGSLQCARELLLAGTTLVSYGDIIYSKTTAINLASCEDDLAITYDPNWYSLWSRRFDNPLIDAETFKIEPNGVVTEIGQRPKSIDDIQGQYMGLLRFTPTSWIEAERIICEWTGNQAKLDMTGLLQKIVKAGRVNLVGIPSSGSWCEIDQPTDLEIATEICRELDRE